MNRRIMDKSLVKLVTTFCILIIAVTNSSAQSSRSLARCQQMKTCGQCLTAGDMCAWCSKPDFPVSIGRCGNESVLLSRGCDADNIVNPTAKVNLVKNTPPRNGDKSVEAVQLSPQEISLKMRPNEKVKFSTSFRLAENYPVDLYFVMDLSQSMEDDKQKLASLGNLLVDQMQTITKNFRVGFGSFVDKKAMPYVSTVPDKLVSPCTGCAAPFGFHNILPLTDDTSKFVREVSGAEISGNLDNFEGGFDALMQAVTCQREIGWRNTSRKILLYSTDGGFHCAGDGKLAGIVIPNDQQCHLDSKGYYSESLTQDYPSISQLRQSITDNNVNVIFAVTKSELSTYTSLSAIISGSTIGELAADSSNIIDLIKDNYNKISSSVTLKSDADDDISVSFKTTCLGTTDLYGEKNITCGGLHLAQSITFDVTVEAKTCPADKRQWKKSFRIFPVGLTEKLAVTVELNCECECEQPQHAERNSRYCNNSGTFSCGACECNEKRFGDQCQCDESQTGSEDHLAMCRKSNTSEVCEGRGTCLCGKCQCNSISTLGDQSQRYSGTHCECNDYSCDYLNSQLCGGPDHGRCNCGLCECNSGWSGRNCHCSTSNSTCLAANGKECNGKGKCVCGECVCEKDSGYQGPKCESCPLCPTECDSYTPCVECTAFENYDRIPQDFCTANCSHVRVVSEINKNGTDSVNWNDCVYRIDGCDAFFRYHKSEKKVEALSTKHCQDPVNPLPIIIGVIVGVLLLGLLLLVIWKICVTLKDRREYARFEKSRENAKWDAGENPIYKQATTTYQNPHYSKAD